MKINVQNVSSEELDTFILKVKKQIENNYDAWETLREEQASEDTYSGRLYKNLSYKLDILLNEKKRRKSQ
jgi:hypothetical protein